MKKQQGDGVFGEVMEMDVPGRRPRGRPKKTLLNNIVEDMYEWNLVEEDVCEEDVYDRVR